VALLLAEIDEQPQKRVQSDPHPVASAHHGASTTAPTFSSRAIWGRGLCTFLYCIICVDLSQVSDGYNEASFLPPSRVLCPWTKASLVRHECSPQGRTPPQTAAWTGTRPPRLFSQPGRHPLVPVAAPYRDHVQARAFLERRLCLLRRALVVASGINALARASGCSRVEPIPGLGAARTPPAAEDLPPIVRQLLHASPVLPGIRKQSVARWCAVRGTAWVCTSAPNLGGAGADPEHPHPTRH